jgi:hypothetical protein
MIKFAITIAAAAALAGLLTALPAPNVEAGTLALESAAPKARIAAPSATSPTTDRPPVATAAACSQRAWPYYDQACLVASGLGSRGEARKVRLIAIDRLQ